MIQYVVCPGSMKSKNDGDWHYIGVAQLVRLYELRPEEYVVYGRHWGYDPTNLRFLYPSYNGNYGRPE